MAINLDILEKMLQQKDVLLSDNTKIRVRAFTMKEYKLLMLASASGSSIESTIVQVLQNCVLSQGIDVERLPIFDLELLYLEVYKLSKGSSLIPVKYQCQNEVDGEQCNEEIAVMVNLNTATVDKPMSGIVKANEQLTIVMRYPNILELEYFDFESDSDVFDLVMRCIDVVELGQDSLKVGTDIQYDEVAQVLDYVDPSTFNMMAEFIQNIPRVHCVFPIECKKCGHVEHARLSGLDDFFA